MIEVQLEESIDTIAPNWTHITFPVSTVFLDVAQGPKSGVGRLIVEVPR